MHAFVCVPFEDKWVTHDEMVFCMVLKYEFVTIEQNVKRIEGGVCSPLPFCRTGSKKMRRIFKSAATEHVV